MTTAAINTDESLGIGQLEMVKFSDSVRSKFGSNDIYTSTNKVVIQTILDKL